MGEFLGRLLSLEAPEAEGGSFRFAEPWPGIVTILVLTGLVWLFWHLYRTEHAPRATRRYRQVLGALRCAAAFVLIFMLFRPLLVVEKVEEGESYVLLLVDDSLSMSLKDRYEDEQQERRFMELAGLAAAGEGSSLPRGALRLDTRSRAELVGRILNNRGLSLLEKLGEQNKLRAYTFSDVLKPVLTPSSEEDGGPAEEDAGQLESEDAASEVHLFPGITPSGHTTRLGEAIAKAANELRGQQIAGMVILSDGQSNSGRSPEESVEDSAVRRVPPFPVLTVGVGSTQAPKDLEILQVLANEAVFVNDEAVFSVLLRNQGFEDGELTIQLRQDGQLVKELPTKAPPDGSSLELKVSYVPRVVGKFSFELRIPGRDKETVTENNAQTHVMRVVDDKVRVLYVADEPSWEYRYLKNALIRDHSVEASCILQSADPEFIQEGNRPIQRFPADREELFQFDVIIFTDADFSRFDETQREALVSSVEDLGGGILFAAGPAHRLRSIHGTKLERLLPIIASSDMPASSGPATEAFKLELTPEGLRHPVMRMAGDPVANTERWGAMPGLYWYLAVRGPKSGALVLARHPYERNDSGNHPVVAAQIYGAGRTLFLAATSTWRWRHLVGDTYFYRFWGQSIRFLSAGRLLGQDKRLHITTDRSVYQLGSEVMVTARLLDELYRPVELAELEGVARDDAGTESALLLEPVARRAGVYRGMFRPSAAGRFEVGIDDAAGASGGSRSFVVKAPSLEFDHPEMNVSLMRRLAEIFGGEYFPLERIEELPGRLSQIRERIVTEVPDDLWDSPLLLLLFAALVILEWSLRKYRMMI